MISDALRFISLLAAGVLVVHFFQDAAVASLVVLLGP